MAEIETLVTDIENLLVNGTTDIPDEAYEQLGKAFADTIKRRMEGQAAEKHEFTLRMSNIGSPCVRKLYLDKNSDPNEKSELNPANALKFLYGDLIEEVLLFFAEHSGHSVEGRQDELEIAGIKGHRDAVIDGVTVDVKSASSFSFKKFKEGKLAEDDPFGYIVQLSSYVIAANDDPLVTDKSRGAFLVVDKQLGHICLDFHEKPDWNMDEAYEQRKTVVNGDELPERSFEAEPDGKSGNEKLGTFCSYCDLKYKCWPELRTFLSSRGPLYLTTVKREPKMVEIDREGNVIEKDE